MSKEKSKQPNLEDLVTMAQAARLRNVTRQTIWIWVKKGRFEVYSIADHQFLSRNEVLAFKGLRAGRPKGTGNSIGKVSSAKKKKA